MYWRVCGWVDSLKGIGCRENWGCFHRKSGTHSIDRRYLELGCLALPNLYLQDPFFLSLAAGIISLTVVWFTLRTLGLYSLMRLFCEGVGIWCMYGFLWYEIREEEGRYVL